VSSRDLLPDATHITLFADIRIAAPPERVFHALTNPEELAQWWGPADAVRAQQWEIDRRVGGEWNARFIDHQGNESTVSGEVRELEFPRTLEYTWRSSKDGFLPTVVRFDLRPSIVQGRRGTHVTVTHTGIGGITACATQPSMPSLEWRKALDRLAWYAGTMVVLARAA
jgi:uncharacterized protein YndB with AHSA1/START domain